MFSEGLDSLLTIYKIIEEGYKSVLVYYDNDCMSETSNIYNAASRIINRYGKDKVEFWELGW